MLRGERITVSPALEDHADPHLRLNYVVAAHLRPGWTGASDLLTRASANSDIATDTCVRREGTDPTTGTRYLEEIAFEIATTQRPGNLTAKAEDLVARGVRRVFAVLPRHGVVQEWRAGNWQTLDSGASIEDRCFAVPLPVRAIFDAASADEAVVRSLLAKGTAALVDILAQRESDRRRQGEIDGRRQGEIDGALRARREVLLAVCTTRGIVLSGTQTEQITRCEDIPRLDGWILRATTSRDAQELFG